MVICVFIEIVDLSNHFSFDNGRVTLEIENKTRCRVMIKETKLYWSILRCLEQNPEDRFLLYI